MNTEAVAEMRVEQAVGLLRSAALAMRSVTASPADRVRAVHAAINALQAQEAELLAVMDETKACENEGAASVTTWAVRELRQDPGTTRQMIRAAQTARDLPSFGAAAHRGQLSHEHVNAMTYGLKHVGDEENGAPSIYARAADAPTAAATTPSARSTT